MDLRTLARVLSMAGACVNVVSASLKEHFVSLNELPFVFPLINLDDFLPNDGKMTVKVVYGIQSGSVFKWFRFVLLEISGFLD